MVNVTRLHVNDISELTLNYFVYQDGFSLLYGLTDIEVLFLFLCGRRNRLKAQNIYHDRTEFSYNVNTNVIYNRFLWGVEKNGLLPYRSKKNKCC